MLMTAETTEDELRREVLRLMSEVARKDAAISDALNYAGLDGWLDAKGSASDVFAISRGNLRKLRAAAGVIERLRWSGHLSLGMAGLHADAIAEIERWQRLYESNERTITALQAQIDALTTR